MIDARDKEEAEEKAKQAYYENNAVDIVWKCGEFGIYDVEQV